MSFFTRIPMTVKRWFRWNGYGYRHHSPCTPTQVERPATDEGFPQVCDGIENLQTELHSIVSRIGVVGETLHDVQTQCRTLLVRNWQAKQEVDRQLGSVLTSLFGILDRIEDGTVRHESAQAVVCSVQFRAQQALQDMDVAEIQVSVGDLFSGRIHDRRSERFSDVPAGKVVEVVHKGYQILAPGISQETILRPAQVVVSLGPRPVAPEVRVPSRPGRPVKKPAPLPPTSRPSGQPVLEVDPVKERCSGSPRPRLPLADDQTQRCDLSADVGDGPEETARKPCKPQNLGYSVVTDDGQNTHPDQSEENSHD